MHIKFSALRQILTVHVPIPYVQGGLRTQASKRGTPLKLVILPILARLDGKQLQIGVDMLLIITSTGDELFSGIDIDDLE